MPLTPPPTHLVDSKGRVTFGMFDAPLPEVDLDRARVKTRAGVPGRFRLKQWQHFAIIHPDVVLTFAIVDAVFTKVAWVQVIDRRTGQVIEHAHRAPALWVHVARSLWDEETTARAPRLHAHVHNHLAAGAHHIDISAGRGRERVEAKLTCKHDLAAIDPLVVCLPVGRGRGMYSHKVPLPVTGTIAVGGKSYHLDAVNSTAILDIHKAHYPRKTWWKWTTFAGFDKTGRRVAVNLTRNVVTDDAMHENAVWVDGTLHALTPAHFDLSGEPWRMGTHDGAVELTFHSDGDRREDMRLGIIESAFTQHYGRYRGTIRLPDETIEVDDWFGLAEDHHAVW